MTLKDEMSRLAVAWIAIWIVGACNGNEPAQPSTEASVRPTDAVPAPSAAVQSTSPSPTIEPVVGRDWGMVPDQGAFHGGFTLGGQSVAVGPQMMVVMDAFGGPVITSSDGFSWASSAQAPKGYARAVIPDGTGFLAVGAVTSYSARDGEAAVWTSPDGAKWRREATASSLQHVGGPEGDAMRNGMFGVTRYQSEFIAVGVVRRGSDAPRAVAWSSRDGRVWQRYGQSFANARMDAVAAGPGGMVAVGRQGEARDRLPDAVAWWSGDGRTWTPRRLAPQGAARAVIPYSGGFIAAGDAHQTATVWVSPDGRTWSAITLPEGRAASGITSVASGLIVASADRNEDARLWSSTDGRAWTSAGEPSLFWGSQTMTVAAARGGVLAFGALTDGPGLVEWRSPP